MHPEGIDIVCGRVPGLGPNILGLSPGYNQYWPGRFMVFWFLFPGAPEGSTSSGSDFKASQKTGSRLNVSSDRLGDAGIKFWSKHSVKY